MSDSFDPYHKWLGIPPEEQPASHYRLLGIKAYESDPDVISNAADQRMAHLRSFQAGQHAADSQRILNEVSAARVCLLNAQKKAAYDAKLRENVAPMIPAAQAEPLDPSSPAVDPFSAIISDPSHNQNADQRSQATTGCPQNRVGQ